MTISRSITRMKLARNALLSSLVARKEALSLSQFTQSVAITKITSKVDRPAMVQNRMIRLYLVFHQVRAPLAHSG